MEFRCQCGLVNFPIPAKKPSRIFCCHCDKCKLITGSAFNIAALIPYFDFPPPEMKDNISTIAQAADTGNQQIGHFCKGCGNRVAHTIPGGKMFVSLSAPRIVGFNWNMLQDKDMTLHCWTKQAVVPIPDELTSFEENVQF